MLESFRKLLLNQCCDAVSKLVEFLFENDSEHSSLTLAALEAKDTAQQAMETVAEPAVKEKVAEEPKVTVDSTVWRPSPRLSRRKQVGTTDSVVLRAPSSLAAFTLVSPLSSDEPMETEASSCPPEAEAAPPEHAPAPESAAPEVSAPEPLSAETAPVAETEAAAAPAKEPAAVEEKPAAAE